MVAARPVPILGLLAADNLDARDVAAKFGAEHLPGAGRPARLVDFPELIAAQFRDWRLHDHAVFERWRAINRRVQAQGPAQLPLSIENRRFQPDRTGLARDAGAPFFGLLAQTQRREKGHVIAARGGLEHEQRRVQTITALILHIGAERFLNVGAYIFELHAREQLRGDLPFAAPGCLGNGQSTGYQTECGEHERLRQSHDRAQAGTGKFGQRIQMPVARRIITTWPFAASELSPSPNRSLPTFPKPRSCHPLDNLGQQSVG